MLFELKIIYLHSLIILPKPFLGYVGGAISLVPYLFFEGISNLFIKNNFLHMK